LRRALLISLSLLLALVGGSTVWAEDGFYVIPVIKKKYAPVPKTGQTIVYVPRDDGALQKGEAWPTPRFTDNQNGTVTDKLTGLIWMKNADGFGGTKTWAEALSAAASLKSGDAGLTDGSNAGDWRLPSIRELQSLIDYGRSNPALPETHPFLEVQGFYWSSTTYPADPTLAWDVFIGGTGEAEGFEKAIADDYVWCVRGGP
jgi:hypothetical protein